MMRRELADAIKAQWKPLAVMVLAVVGLAVMPAVPSHADPGCYDAGSAECGGHTWSGPVRQTWDTPGYYGGWTGGNTLLCSPFDYDCQGVSPAGPPSS